MFPCQVPVPASAVGPLGARHTTEATSSPAAAGSPSCAEGTAALGMGGGQAAPAKAPQGARELLHTRLGAQRCFGIKATGVIKGGPSSACQASSNTALLP